MPNNNNAAGTEKVNATGGIIVGPGGAKCKSAANSGPDKKYSPAGAPGDACPLCKCTNPNN